MTLKAPLYEQVLRVREYFRFDPTGDYLTPRLQGSRLEHNVYVPLELVDNRLCSEVLDAFLQAEGRFLRLVDAQTGETVLTTPERQARLMEAEAQIREASRRAEIAEAEAQRASEAENARLRAQIAALQAQTRQNETG